ncbi:NADH-quinone oxidoreductase subunit NuoE [Chloroflexota bacterium]
MSNQIDLSLLEPVLENYENEGDALIAILQEIQEVYSYLPEGALQRLSSQAKIPMSRIYAVATFYAQFYLTPRGRNTIRICRGTACHVRGGSRILDAVERELGVKEGETTSDLEYSLETVACIGACALAPTMVINQTTHGKVTPNKVTDIFNQMNRKEQESE